MAEKKIAYSYSSISKFETCPRQWYSQYVLKDIPFVPNEATEWGKDVHSAFDKRFKTKVEMTGRYSQFEPMAKAIESKGGVLKSEYEMVLKEDGSVTSWWDKDAHQRAKTDVSIFNGDKAELLDFKTGKYRPDTEELEYFATMTFQIHEEIDKIKTVYLWLKNDGPPTVDFYSRDQFEALRGKFDKKIESIEEALIHDLFPKKPSGLCKNYCGSVSCDRSGAYKPKKF